MITLYQTARSEEDVIFENYSIQKLTGGNPSSLYAVQMATNKH